MSKPVLMLGLDGWSQDIADVLIAEGRLPTFARLQEVGTCIALDHGEARRTGLAWEHVATGRSPDDARRWSAVDFDTSTYRAELKTTRQRPFVADLPVSAVIFDAPYFDLSAATNAKGLVSWGAHDPGVARFANPASLSDELDERFGPYPAKRYIYGEVWYDRDDADAMADALIRAVEVRADATEWLLAERLPDWDLAIVVASEFHSAAEALYHGWDAGHPVNNAASSTAARKGLVGVYEAADRMVARLLARFPQACFVLFSLHGLGPNNSDVASMALLPELLYRMQFGRPFMRDYPVDECSRPLLPRNGGWSKCVNSLIPKPSVFNRAINRLVGSKISPQSMYWMPAARYQPNWRRMKSFALPSFYDGRIRINLAGRESSGIVQPDQYEAELDRIEATLRECLHVDRPNPIVAKIERNAGRALDLQPSQADMVVLWEGAPLGLVHPRHGRIGPLPHRRTGGHTGGDGVAYFSGEGIRRCEIERRSAFDVVPTVIEMLGCSPLGITGKSFADRFSS